MSEAIRVEWQQAEELKNQGNLHEAATCFSRVLRLLREEATAQDADGNRVSELVGKLQKKAEQEVAGTCKTMRSASPYLVLGLEGVTALKGVKKAYRKMALKYHPDRNPDSKDVFVVVQVSREIDVLLSLSERCGI